jgi:hypothetical protein
MMKACAAAIRDGVPISLFPQATEEICSALQLESEMKELGATSFRDFAYLTLSDSLSDSTSTGDFDLLQSLADSARSVFLELRQSCSTATEKQVVDRLAAVFVERVIKTRFWLALETESWSNVSVLFKIRLVGSKNYGKN